MASSRRVCTTMRDDGMDRRDWPSRLATRGRASGERRTMVQDMLGKRRSPVEQAYDYILEGILSGELMPGMRIPTEAVAETLGISRMPVRDALRRLEGDGAITIFANRGASVSEYTQDEVVELIEMRAVLEGLAARLALPQITEADIEELGHLKWRMERASDTLPKWISYHDDFHNFLTSLSNRPLIMQQTQRMRLMLRPYFRRYYAESRELEIAGLEHQKIVEAVRDGDPEALERTVRAHVRANVASVARLA